MTDDEFDNLIDDATHAVNNLIPDEALARMSQASHSAFLYRINDALTPILRDLIPFEG